jgi:hypothetical protein
MLPAPYERWFVELAGRASPIESRSTCESCAMVPTFDAALKCCTFHPSLAPHFVGAILASGGGARDKVLARIAARDGVSPLGLLPPRDWPKSGEFGRSPELRCPFFDGNCSIWPHRGAQCASFHCKLDVGAYSGGFWGVVTAAFNAVERALARRLLAERGLDAAACDALLRAPSDETDAQAWGTWRGREEGYFVGAAEWVASLSWADVVACAPELPRVADALRKALASLDIVLPERVRASGEVVYQIRRAHHPAALLDPLEVPAALAERLPTLPPTPLGELGVDDDTARRLLAWRLIVPA